VNRKKGVRYVFGILVGGLVGYFLNYVICCSGGACPLSRNPLAGIFIGGILGLILVWENPDRKNSRLE